MKTITKYFLGLALVGALVGCKDKMRELNTNPGVITKTKVEYQFADATWEWESKSRDAQMGSWSSTGVVMQYFLRGSSASSYANTEASSYPNMSIYSAAWNDYYSNQVGNKLNALINYIDTVIDEIERPDYADARAIAEILQVQSLWRIVDVYGAIVWKEAFRTNEGIMTPTYDLIQDIYKDFDQIVKDQIAILKAEPTANSIKLGKYDYFYGWKYTAQSGGGALLEEVTDNVKQRANWAKMANMLRVKMAWRFKSRDNAHYTAVMSEVMADPTNNLFQDASEGCYYHYQSEYTSNADDISNIGMYSVLTDNFVTYLKDNNDPRLPLLGRFNWLDPQAYSIISPNYAGMGDRYNWVMRYCPDSLMDQYGPEIVNELYLGQSANPAQVDISNKAGKFLGDPEIIVRLRNPAGTFPWTFPTPNDGPFTVYTRKDTTVSLRVAARAQGRYFVRSGGASNSVASSGGNGGDGPGGDNTCRLRRQVLTYADQCFMLSYLSVEDGTSYGGKSAAQWYTEGIQAAMDELFADALGAKIQIAVDARHKNIAARIPGIDPVRGVYVLTQTMIDDYLAGHPFPAAVEDQKQAIVGQVWVNNYKRSEEMWAWWKLTGYPKTLIVADPVNRPTDKMPYFMAPYAGPVAEGTDNSITEKPLQFTRRNVIPQPLVENNANYAAVQALLEAVPGYGHFFENTGRIWWDTGIAK